LSSRGKIRCSFLWFCPWAVIND